MEAENLEPGDPFYLYVPVPGEVWHWRPDLPHASEVVVITRCWWNGDEWWVENRLDSDVGGRRRNDMDTFLQSAILLRPARRNTRV